MNGSHPKVKLQSHTRIVLQLRKASDVCVCWNEQHSDMEFGPMKWTNTNGQIRRIWCWTAAILIVVLCWKLSTGLLSLSLSIVRWLISIEGNRATATMWISTVYRLRWWESRVLFSFFCFYDREITRNALKIWLFAQSSLVVSRSFVYLLVSSLRTLLFAQEFYTLLSLFVSFIRNVNHFRWVQLPRTTRR